jgi:hypothetical protein
MTGTPSALSKQRALFKKHEHHSLPSEFKKLAPLQLSFKHPGLPADKVMLAQAKRLEKYQQAKTKKRNKQLSQIRAASVSPPAPAPRR